MIAARVTQINTLDEQAIAILGIKTKLGILLGNR